MGRRNATGKAHIDFCEGNGLSPTLGLKSPRGDCTPVQHQEIDVDTSWTAYM
jgi:hypothetical protein